MDPRAQFEEAARLQSAGDLAAALELFLAVAARAPSDAAALVRAGQIQIELNCRDAAIETLREAVTRHRENATGWFLLAQCLAETAAWAEAAQGFQQVVDLRPDLGLGHANLAVALTRVGESDRALKALRAAARLDAGDPARHEALGQALHAAREMEAAARSHLRHMLLRPDSPVAHHNLGITLPLIGDRDRGARHLLIALFLKPDGAIGWTALARALDRAGRREKAHTAWMRAALTSPDAADPAIGLALGERETTPWVRRAAILEPGWTDRIQLLANQLLKRGRAAQVIRLLTEMPAVVINAAGPTKLLARARDALTDNTGETGPPQGADGRYATWIKARSAMTKAPAIMASARLLILIRSSGKDRDALGETIADLEERDHEGLEIRVIRDVSEANGILQQNAASHAMFLAVGDRLARDSLNRVICVLSQDPELNIIYGDEDRFDPSGRRSDPWFKSRWNPDLMEARNELGGAVFLRRRAILDAGGLAGDLPAGHVHDLALRIGFTAGLDRIRHLPHILLHRRSAEDPPEVTRMVLQHHFRRLGLPVELRVEDGHCRVRHCVPEPSPLVSIVIPTRDRAELLRACVEGLKSRTDYQPLEIILIDNGSREPDAVALIERLEGEENITVLRDPSPFNFSKLSNLGAARAKGQYLCFLNNDVEPITPDWLSEMVATAARPGVGVVGAKLLYPGGRVQHAGVVLSGNHVARHLHAGIDRSAPGYRDRAQLPQTLSAVTGACMLVPRGAFEEVGGFDTEAFPVDFNDIDLCLRIGAAGWRTVWTPHALMLHHESASRGSYITAEKEVRLARDRDEMHRRWRSLLYDDPYYNPNLTLDVDAEAFEVAMPPRPVD